MPTCAPISSQLQVIDGTDSRYRPEHFLNGIKACTIYKLGLEPNKPDQKKIWHVRSMVLDATSLDDPTSSWFNGFSEADTQDWSTLTVKFLDQFEKYKPQHTAQAEAQNAPLNTHKSNSIYACRVEDLVNKGRPENDAKMRRWITD